MSGRGDIETVIAVDAFGGAGIVVSLLDFLMLQRRSILGVDLVGVVLFLLGVAVEVSALRALGGQYSPRIRANDGQRLVQSGPYRFIRHPTYLGLIAVFFSAPVAWTSAYGALVALPTIPLLLRRINLEEKAMTARFGAEYASYMQRTKKLVPSIY